MAESIMKKKPTVPKEYYPDAEAVQKQYSLAKPLTKLQMDAISKKAVELKLQTPQVINTLKENITIDKGELTVGTSIKRIKNRLASDKRLQTPLQKDEKQEKDMVNRLRDKLVSSTGIHVETLEGKIKRNENILNILETFKNDKDLLERIGVKE